MAFLIIYINYSNTLVVQLFYSIFCSTYISTINKTCFIFKWRSIIIISHICIIRYVISLKTWLTSWSIRVIVTILDQIVHKHCNINKICLNNIGIIDFCSTILKWCVILKRYLCSCSKWLISLNRVITFL